MTDPTSAEQIALLTQRLEQRTAALDRVVAQKEAFREALVRILELEGERIPTGGDDLTDPMLSVEAVHDAVGSDLIGYLMYRQRWIMSMPKREGDTLPLDWDEAKHGKIFWRDPDPKSAVQHAEALEKLRREGMFKPFEKADLGPYLDALDKHVAELTRTHLDPVFGTYEAPQDRPVDMPAPLPRCSCMHGFDGADGPKIVRRDTACPIHGEEVHRQAARPCVCTWSLVPGGFHQIVDLEPTCPAHGSTKCPMCGSSDPKQRKAVDDQALWPCSDSWHIR